MPRVQVDDVEVDFPFTPYANQITYMQSFLRCLKAGQNCALEASTGFGKTLCIICLATAFVRRCEEIVQKLKKHVPLSPDEAAFVSSTAVFKKNGNGDAKIPQIIYTSRTHAQLQQVSAQLR